MAMLSASFHNSVNSLLKYAFRAKGQDILNQAELMICVISICDGAYLKKSHIIYKDLNVAPFPPFPLPTPVSKNWLTFVPGRGPIKNKRRLSNEAHAAAP